MHASMPNKEEYVAEMDRNLGLFRRDFDENIKNNSF